MQLSSGDKLGSYEILAHIGAGGMGEVYRARDPRLGRDVAVKVLPATMAEDPERLARFQREARAVAALNHPHIVTIFSVEEAGGSNFLTMELVEGQPLDRMIPSSGLALDQIVEIAGALADALAAAHEKGIVHRDLKPANIMVTHDGRVKVLDFGLAKDVRVAAPDDVTRTSLSNTQAGMVMGTPAYMSPEQISGRPLDHRTDIFSLGVVLHEMATGRQPFEGESSAELISAVLRDTPDAVTDVRPDLPADLARIIRRCLEKDPRHRVQTARDVSNEFRDLARQAPQKTPATPTRSRTTPAADSGSTRADEGFWVAVLPFKYSGDNADLTALAEGLSEDIATGLSRFSYLRVIARSSTSRLAKDAGDIRAAGKELGARYVMEGSLRQAGSKLRIAVQVVDAVTGAHLWAETYERTFSPDKLFELQDDLVPRIVSITADTYGILPRSMAEMLRAVDPESLKPYEAVLRSFAHFQRVNAEEHAASRKALERAVAQQPGYADGWAMLSLILKEEFLHELNLQPDSLNRSLAAALRAVEAGPSNHLAYHALASVQFFLGDRSAFRIAAERALELNPLDGFTVAFLGSLIAYDGDWERGAALAARARELNPHHPGWYWLVAGFNAYRKAEYRLALEFARKINMPNFWRRCVILAAAHGQLGEMDEAHKALKDLLALKPDYAEFGPRFFNRWLQQEMVEFLSDGLRKAGLGIADEKKPNDEKPAFAQPAAQSANRSGAHALSGAASAAPSIAVLPFANLSAEKDQEYFSDGLAEEIINLLAHVSGLRVIARTSAFAFRGKEQDIRGIADALGVGTVLQGSVRRSGSRILVTAQLINVADSSHLWSERYDREMTDVFAIQDEIAAAIAEQLKVSLTATPAAEKHTPPFAAYEALLQARHHLYKFSPDSMARAVQCLEKALSIDPEYAAAYTSMTMYYCRLAEMGAANAAEVLPKARAAALKALSLDDGMAGAHASLGMVCAFADYNWDEAGSHFRRALQLNPDSPEVIALYAKYLMPLGRLDEAQLGLNRWLQRDPLSIIARNSSAWNLAILRRYDDCAAMAQETLSLEPNDALSLFCLIASKVGFRQYEEAISIAEHVAQVHKQWIVPLAFLGIAYARGGRPTDARRVLAEIHEMSAMSGYLHANAVASVHVALGETDTAANLVEQAIDQREIVIALLKVWDIYDDFRSHPRYPALLKRMNLL